MLKTILEDVVRAEWLDYNGHMNVVYYHQLFDRATDKLWERVGLGAEFAARGVGSVFAIEDHFVYERELRLDARVGIDLQILDLDDKRIHFFQWLRREDGRTAATCEHLSIYVDFATRRAAPFPLEIYDRIDELWRSHRSAPAPDNAGRKVGIRR